MGRAVWSQVADRLATADAHSASSIPTQVVCSVTLDYKCLNGTRTGEQRGDRYCGQKSGPGF